MNKKLITRVYVATSLAVILILSLALSLAWKNERVLSHQINQQHITK